jgi:excinuclease ABC subunit C
LLENAVANPDIAAESQESVIEIQRRLARLGKAKVLLPDLVIVDGGKGQLSSAMAELQQLQLHELPVIGLAKQREEVFRPGESEPLVIPHDRGALKLLQRIRDEAHRFANAYNALLLRRRMKESLLDDCPGMTAGRKILLMKRFGSVAGLRKAGFEEIAQCRGITKSFAESLYQWLHRAE